MAHDTDGTEIVSRFFLDAYEFRKRIKVNMRAVQALLYCTEIASRPTQFGSERQDIPLTTGSVAEFYIDPLLPCAGDFDIMYYRSTQLAIPAGYLPPIGLQLPGEFGSFPR